MWTSAIGIASLTAGLLVAPASAQADPDLCGWSGHVRPLMAQAARDVRALDLPKLAAEYYGKGLTLVDITMAEVDLGGEPGETDPLKAVTLTSNRVAFNTNLAKKNGRVVGMSLLITYNGMCMDEVITNDEGWGGSTGVNKKLRIGANQALRLAQEYRQDNPGRFPPDNPLIAMNLMQATTAAADFGKLRWYVNYDDGQGNVQILSVYMDGTVKPR